MEDDKKFSYFFLGLGIGVAAGILFAPKSGAETRELLREKADEGKDYVKRRSEDIKETANELLDKSKQAVLRQKEQLAAAVEAGRSAYREKVDTVTTVSDPGDELIEGV
ncbi:YtxH domain-containing protein [uncultured Paludibaculum sp.]|uniref:YtxH domain-containing protein n=1 Tax=uncultured Paludibaculum sp. TaxID=1765020 RepID=UPI002AAA8D04|nr:YtxH domain-containing protein [uncultured Paludibaculum sp.]